MKDIDDIEILDLEPKREIKKENVVKENKNIETRVKKEEVQMKKKRKVKKGKMFQLIFCLVSFLFILGCLIHYGSRFIKYYRIYNPKVDSSGGALLLSSYITGNSEIVYEGSGLYITSGNYIYKGDVSNNYIKFNNLLWRIIRINKDNTIEVILDDYLNMLPYSSSPVSFDKSDIYKYLEEKVFNNIDKDMLVKENICTDMVSDLSNIKCDNTASSYVKLLDITGFLNTVKDKKSYLVSDDEIFWLSDYDEDKVWHTNGVNVSSSKETSFYEIRPVIKLKNSVTFESGDGTKEKPYIIKNNKLSLGSRVKLGEDTYIVYDISDNIKLMSEKVLEDKKTYDKNSLKFNVENEESLGKYLNTTYYESLSYKDKLVKNNWYIGEFKNSISDMESEKVESFIGIPSMLDIKLDSSVNGYFTTTYNNDMLWVYENPLRVSRSTSERNVRITIAISKDNINKLKEDNGIFKLEG